MSSSTTNHPDAHSTLIPAEKAKDRNGMRGYGWISLLLAVIGVVALWFDTAVMEWVVPENMQWIPGDLIRVIRLSELFAHGYGVALIAIGILCLASSYKRFVPRIVLCALWPAMVVNLIKVCFGRNRPVRYFDDEWAAHFPASISDSWLGWMAGSGFSGEHVVQSFPSAHTATVWGFAIGMCWVFPKGRFLFGTVALLASLQRIISLAHWPSDVVFGAALAFLLSGALTQRWGVGYYLGKFENRAVVAPNAAGPNVAGPKVELAIEEGSDELSDENRVQKVA